MVATSSYGNGIARLSGSTALDNKNRSDLRALQSTVSARKNYSRSPGLVPGFSLTVGRRYDCDKKSPAMSRAISTLTPRAETYRFVGAILARSPLNGL
jgi:hypothetical protein